ncbi:MAG TPA: MYXO-CTERM sorting domain-containing protein [Polyangia bacterium]|nr:MYXO-CTERM sorting domain-containing protein [Polyangia bacterium]
MARRSKGFWSMSLVMAAVGAVACAPEDGATSVQRSQGALAPGDRGDLDILFMIDNSSSMTPLQMKMLTQDPSFMTVLAGFPNGLPNIHVAVVSSDMGAPGDSSSSIGCTTTGDNGVFQSTPRGTCASTTLTAGSKFISNVGGQANYTGSLPDVFSCIAQLGSSGCGFEHQLAAVARALGADGAAPPPENAGFLRPNAELAIVMLTNEDDCSAKANTTLFSLNGGTQSITNPLGPIANYRCNQFGHLCKNPLSATPNALISPPLNAPANGTTPPSLTLTDCESNDTGMLASVADLVAGIKGLKAHPDDQIVVGAISPPKTPYTAVWLPPSAPPPGTSGELWPQIQHSCGAAGDSNVNPAATQHTTDGSFGDPGVRISQWVQGFGANGVVASICDADYGIAFQAIADKIQAHLQPSAGTGAGGAGGAAATGTAGISGGVGGAGGHGGVGIAGASGSAGQSGGVAGSSGTAGISGTTGVAGIGGTGTAGNTGTAGSTSSGVAGNSGSTGTAGNLGGAGRGAGGGSTGIAGNSGGTGNGGNTAGGGANGNTGGAGGAGTGHTGGAGGSTTATGAGGASAGASGTGVGGQAGSGTGIAGSAGGGAGGRAGTAGHAGAAGGTGGPSNASSDGCSCETAGSPASGWNLTLLLGALGLVVSRRSSRRSNGRR